MKRELISGLVAVSATALAATAFAQNQQGQQDQAQQQPRQQDQQSQQSQQNQPLADYEPGASVILSGTIASVEEQGFTLDYGDDQVQVSLDEWDLDGDLTEALTQGQQVTVSGTVDDGWFERREINADNIYLTESYTYYYIVDENPAYETQQSRRETQQDATFISTRGQVTETSEDKLTIESQGNTLQVDLSELGYDPLDEQGIQQIQQGDRVYVFGDVDENFFETKTLSAESLITLSQAGGAQQGQPGQSQGQQQSDPQSAEPQGQQPQQRQQPQQGQQPNQAQ